MSAETTNLSHIQDEDVLRKMWQETEDFGKKKEIRSHMYKLREQRLREFYNGSEITESKSSTTTGKVTDRSTHTDSLLDQSFQSFKSKEVRDSESPTREIHYKVPGKMDDHEWQMASNKETSPDGKTKIHSTKAAVEGHQKIDGGQLDFKARTENRSSEYQDVSDNSVTNRSENFSQSSTSTRMFTSTPPEKIEIPSNIQGVTKVTRETKTLPDGSTVITTRYDTTSGASHITSQTGHMTASQTSSSSRQINENLSSNTLNNNKQIELPSDSRALVKTSTHMKILPDEVTTSSTRSNIVSDDITNISKSEHVKTSHLTSSSRFHDERSSTVNVSSQSDNLQSGARITKHNTKLTDDSAHTTSRNETEATETTRSNRVANIKDSSTNISSNPTHPHDLQGVTKISKETKTLPDGSIVTTTKYDTINGTTTYTEVTGHTKMSKDYSTTNKSTRHSEDIINDKHHNQKIYVDNKQLVRDNEHNITDTSFIKSTKEKNTTNIVKDHHIIENKNMNENKTNDVNVDTISRTSIDISNKRPTVKLTDKINENISEKLHSDTFINTEREQEVVTRDKNVREVVSKVQETPDDRKPRGRSPTKTVPTKAQPTKPLDEKYETTYRTDYTNKKRISVEVSATHDAFAKSLRSVSPDRIPSRASHRSSNSSLPEKNRYPSKMSPDRQHKDRARSPTKSTNMFSSTDTYIFNKKKTTKDEPYKRSPSPKRYSSTDKRTTTEETITTTSDINKTSFQPSPRSRTPSPTKPREYLRKVDDIVTDLDDVTVLKKQKPDSRPTTLELTRKTKKVTDRSPSSPLTDLGSPKRSPSKEVRRSSSLKSPSKESPTLSKTIPSEYNLKSPTKHSPDKPSKNLPEDRPLKRTDTYEERCRQILGITEATEKRKSSLDRTLSKTNSFRRNISSHNDNTERVTSPVKSPTKERQSSPSKSAAKPNYSSPTKERVSSPDKSAAKPNYSSPTKERVSSPDKSAARPNYSSPTKERLPSPDKSTAKPNYSSPTKERVSSPDKSAAKPNYSSPTKERVSSPEKSAAKPNYSSPTKERVSSPDKSAAKPNLSSPTKERLPSPDKSAAKPNLSSPVKERLPSPDKSATKPSPTTNNVTSTITGKPSSTPFNKNIQETTEVHDINISIERNIFENEPVLIEFEEQTKVMESPTKIRPVSPTKSDKSKPTNREDSITQNFIHEIVTEKLETSNIRNTNDFTNKSTETHIIEGHQVPRTGPISEYPSQKRYPTRDSQQNIKETIEITTTKYNEIIDKPNENINYKPNKVTDKKPRAGISPTKATSKPITQDDKTVVHNISQERISTQHLTDISVTNQINNISTYNTDSNTPTDDEHITTPNRFPDIIKQTNDHFKDSNTLTNKHKNTKEFLIQERIFTDIHSSTEALIDESDITISLKPSKDSNSTDKKPKNKVPQKSSVPTVKKPSGTDILKNNKDIPLTETDRTRTSQQTKQKTTEFKKQVHERDLEENYEVEETLQKHFKRQEVVSKNLKKPSSLKKEPQTTEPKVTETPLRPLEKKETKLTSDEDITEEVITVTRKTPKKSTEQPTQPTLPSTKQTGKENILPVQIETTKRENGNSEDIAQTDDILIEEFIVTDDSDVPKVTIGKPISKLQKPIKVTTNLPKKPKTLDDSLTGDETDFAHEIVVTDEFEIVNISPQKPSPFEKKTTTQYPSQIKKTPSKSIPKKENGPKDKPSKTQLPEFHYQIKKNKKPVNKETIITEKYIEPISYENRIPVEEPLMTKKYFKPHCIEDDLRDVEKVTEDFIDVEIKQTNANTNPKINKPVDKEATTVPKTRTPTVTKKVQKPVVDQTNRTIYKPASKKPVNGTAEPKQTLVPTNKPRYKNVPEETEKVYKTSTIPTRTTSKVVVNGFHKPNKQKETQTVVLNSVRLPKQTISETVIKKITKTTNLKVTPEQKPKKIIPDKTTKSPSKVSSITKNIPSQPNQITTKKHVVTTTITLNDHTKPKLPKNVKSERNKPNDLKPKRDYLSTDTEEEEMIIENTTENIDVSRRSVTKKPEKKCITTKTVIINNNDTEQRHMIVDLQRSKSSREPTPDRICPVPTNKGGYESPRYPDEIIEPDEEIIRVKPKRLSDIPLTESEDVHNFSRITEIIDTTVKTDVNKVEQTDESLLSVNKKINLFLDTADKLTKSNKKSSGPAPKVGRPQLEVTEDLEYDECLLSVSEKVNKFVNKTDQLMNVRDIPERPKSPRCKFNDKSFSDAFITTEQKHLQKESITHERDNVSLEDLNETSRRPVGIQQIHKSTPISDFITNKPVDKFDNTIPEREQQTGRAAYQPMPVDSVDRYEQKYPNYNTITKRISLENLDIQISNKQTDDTTHTLRESTTSYSKHHAPRTSPTPLHREDSPNRTLPSTLSETPPRRPSNEYGSIKKTKPKDAALIRNDSLPKTDTTPQSSKTKQIDDTKKALSSTSRLRSTESIKKARALFENISKEPEIVGPKSKSPILNKNLPLTGKKDTIPRKLSYSNDDDVYTAEILKPRSFSPGKNNPQEVPREIHSETSDIPHYMLPLDRDIKDHTPRYRSPEKDCIRSSSPHVDSVTSDIPYDSESSDIPHYMLPLGRNNQTGRPKSRSPERAKSPDITPQNKNYKLNTSSHIKDSTRSNSNQSRTEIRDIPHYMLPLGKDNSRSSSPEKQRIRPSSPDGQFEIRGGREPKDNRPRSRSPGRDRSSSPEIPHYMLPLDRYTKAHTPRSTSPGRESIRTSSPDVRSESSDIPHYMLPLDRSIHTHSPQRDNVAPAAHVDSKTTKFGVTLRKVHSESPTKALPKTVVTKTTIERRVGNSETITEQDIEEIFELEILEELLQKITSYELRRVIRTQIRLVRKLIIENTLEIYIKERALHKRDQITQQRTPSPTKPKSNDIERKSTPRVSSPNKQHTTHEKTIKEDTKYTNTTKQTSHPTEIIRKPDASPERNSTTITKYSSTREHKPTSTEIVSTEIKSSYTSKSTSEVPSSREHKKRTEEIRRLSPERGNNITSIESISKTERIQTSTNKTTTSSIRSSPDRGQQRPEVKNNSLLRKTETSPKKVEDDKPEWITKRNLKKVTTTNKTNEKLTASSRKIVKEEKQIKSTEMLPTDLITSSYGVGPTDENGTPLFGLKALRTQHTNNDTMKVQGTFIKSEYYSENGQQPVGQISVTKYSTDPRDLSTDEQIENNDLVTSVTTTQKFGYEDSPSLDALTTKKAIKQIEEIVPSDDKSSNFKRQNSVKALSQKFIDTAVESLKNERQTSYPKAGLILRTSSFKDSKNDNDDEEISSSVVTTSKSSKQTTSTKTSGGTFLSNKTTVSGVSDIISRMKTEEYEEGETSEDIEARNLLNKFIGSQVLISGIENRESSIATSKTLTSDSAPTTTSTRKTMKITTKTTEGGKTQTKTLVFQSPITEDELENIWDEKTLRLLLEQSTDYEERRVIRNRLRTVMAEQEACADLVEKASQEQTSGKIEESMSIQKSTTDSPTTTTTKVTKISTQQQITKKPLSPFAKFRQLDKQNSLNTPPGTPGTPKSPGNGPLFKFTDPAVSQSAATIKDRLLFWCKMKTKEYENVQLDNFSTSWADGLAFCALIHHFLPEAFDYHALTPNERRHNFELAFKVASEKADIFPLLDVDDMMATRRPDWKCVFTYVQSIYRRFKDEEI